MGQAMGMKCFRIWANLSDLYKIDENDNFTRNEDYATRLHNFVATMKSKGIERFSLLMGGRIMLKGYEEYSTSSIPDPTSDYELYLRQINAEAKAYTMLARDFPEIEYFEPINEPDHYLCSAINKFGYVYNPLSVDSNTEYIFTNDELAHIIMDYCWYIRRAIKSSNPNGKLLFPALCHFASSPLFLESCYKTIYSKTLPAGQEYSDTDPDNYFDVLNWHPYSNSMFGVGDEIGDLWVERQMEFYNVACEYGDAEKPVWFTEFGYSDGGNENIRGKLNADGTITGQAPKGYVDVFKTIKEKLPFVETIFCFRLTDMYSMKYDSAASGENSFGMFYNPQDPDKRGMPKPSAL
nr:hypothetical protein [Clostridia bacterium]